MTYRIICTALVACWCHQVMAPAVTLRATEISLVLMHSDIVNGYQLLCDAHTVLEPHRGTAAFSFFYSLSSFSTFSFFLSLLTVLFLFLGASIVCVSNTIYRGQQIVL